MRRFAGLLVVLGAVSFAGIPEASAECGLGRKCLDQPAVQAVRDEIRTLCDCSGADKPKTYKKCAKSLVKAAVAGGVLPKGCKRGVMKCEAKSICGRSGAVACCATKRNGKVKARIAKSPEKCRGEVCIGHNSAGDACSPDGSCAPLVRPFRNVQQVFSESCSLPTCHSAAARQGDLVLDDEELSFASLVNEDATHEDAPPGTKRVVPGDSANSFLIQKLRGTGVGDAMPQNLPALPDAIIGMIAGWIDRGAPTTADECAPIEVETSTAVAGEYTVVSAPHNTSGATVCDDRPIITGNYEWEPEAPLPAPAPSEGVQLYSPPRPVLSGTEWETCFAVKLDTAKIKADMGLASNEPLVIKDQLYRMHEGSHHLLVYNYFGSDPDGFPEGYFPCVAANCVNDGDCPDDNGSRIIPIGGTQVAGTRYEVTYPGGVGIPILGPLVILNLHYTNPFQPAQDIYGESWVNFDFYKSGEYKVQLDGVFAINSSFVVEPFETVTTHRIWQPRGLLLGLPKDAAVFQLFGHMHLRGRRFIIDRVSGGQCSAAGASCTSNGDCSGRQSCIDGTCQQLCGRDDDCPGAQTCVLGPDASDVKIYDTRSWDNAPVTDYPPPYLRVDKDEGLRWTCVHSNGILGENDEEILPPKRCHEGCRACGWDDADGKCHFRDGRVFDEGVPMPLVFGVLADDDMCNMFGYYLPADRLDDIGP